MRFLEALAISIVFVIFSVNFHALLAFRQQSHYIFTVNRALAWFLLRSDSLPYKENFEKLVVETIPNVVYIKNGDHIVYLENSSTFHAFRLIWLGFNGSISPRVVVIGIEP